MNDNNIPEDFSMFATGKRIKKEEVIAPKSPLDSGSKWNIHNEVQAEAPKREYQPPPVAAQPVIQVRTQTINDEEIGNVGSELQKFRKYPQKKYDTLMNKMVLFNEEEYFLIRDLSSEISLARKRSNIVNKGSLPRITENTVIRAALKAVFSKIGKSPMDMTMLQTEEALEAYFNSLLK